jgi:DNA-binding Xre family transcriptional regulator
MIVPKLKDYLTTLKFNQIAKPEDEKQPLPSLLEIHEQTGVSYNSLYKIANGKSKRLDLNTVQRVIEYMHSLGHDMNICDFVEYKRMDQKIG